MSQSDSGRKYLLKKLILQCIQEPPEATETGRLERQVTLQTLLPSLKAEPQNESPPLDLPQNTDLERSDLNHKDVLKGLALKIQALDQRTELLRCDQVSEIAALQERLTHLESGFDRVTKVVDSLQIPPEDADFAAEKEATTKVLASLNKLVEGMRLSEAQRKFEIGGTRS